MGELIASFHGSYRTGPDVGAGPEGMVVLKGVSPYAYCAPPEHGGTGDSSGPTATGVLAALRSGARHVFGDASCAGRTVVISGFGAVGSGIAAGPAAEGAQVVVSDVEPSRKAQALASGYGWGEPAQALSPPADILVPATVGGVLDDETVPHITARLIVGPANNQLTEERTADTLADRGIVWIPDFAASAGGIAYTLGRESHTAPMRRRCGGWRASPTPSAASSRRRDRPASPPCGRPGGSPNAGCPPPRRPPRGGGDVPANPAATP
ncbi:hypothetical protein [Streptomyces sp. NPDC126514]|uniref:hypothetical protein n=1 Tax=Streptomyces sp. NPDC126514 TaxID=3155210 RepID=UPI00331752DE